MEEISPKNNFVRRSKKKKATVVESSKTKKIQIHHKRSNSEQAKRVPNKAVTALNLITKGPSINKLFFKNDNISLKSESMPKANKKMVKKYKSYNIEKCKNEIISNISMKKFNPIQKGSNTNVNYMNMDCIEKVHDLKGEAKCFETNNMANIKKSRKPNFIVKSCVSNDKLIPFNNSLNRNPIYDFYQPVNENEILKKPLQKIQSVNQEKRQYKFSDFKVIKDAKEEESDDSYGNINPDDYREGNNIEFITGSSFSEENDGSSSISSGEEKKMSNANSIRRQSKDKKIKEIKKQKSDKLSSLVNKSFKNSEPCKPQRHLSHNYFNSNNNSEIEDNYFKNDTKFFISPKVNSKHPSNKSLKSDAKSDYFNKPIAYFNDSASNNDINRNSFLGGIVNKNKIRKIESLATNSNNDYEGDIDDEYDLNETGNQFNHFIDPNRLVNNLIINDSFSNIKSTDISQNHTNNTMNNDSLPIKNNNKNDNIDNYKNNYNYYLDENENRIHPSNNLSKINISKNINNINNINTNTMSPNSNSGLDINNFVGNPNQSNIINIHNMNNFNNNNFIFGNGNAGINPNQININMGNSNNKKLKNSINNIMNNNNIPQNNMVPDPSAYLFNNNNNLYNISTNNIMNDPNFSPNNFIIKNNNNQILPFQLNQLIQQNKLINENNNDFINYDLNQNNNSYLLNNPNYFQQNINNINSNINNNINASMNNNMGNNMNNINSNLNPNYYHVNKFFNSNNRADNNNINMNYLNYYRLQNNINQDINNNLGNYFSENNQFRYSSETKKLRKSSYQSQNMMGQNMMTVSNPNANINVNHPNYMNSLQYNNYMNNLNNSLNYNNMSLKNKMFNLNNNNPIIPNNNINQNLSHSQNININPNLISPANNNMNLNNNYQIINGMQNINNIILNNNIINNTSRQNNYSSNKQKKQNYNLLSNEELAKQAYILAKNQNGCRYLQKRIENNQKLVPTLFFPNVLGHIQELSNDQFGNYYIKIIIKYLPEDMIYKFISLIHPSISKIGTNQYGTKVIQYLIDFLNNEKNLLFFIEKILPHLVALINDLNGIHIVQRLIFIKSSYIQIVYDKIFDNIQLIAVTRDGSNFIKKLIEFLDEDNMTSLIKAINDNLAVIITNQHGNYIIQNIIMKENLYLKFGIIETIIKNIVSFSNQKFSSNVVEKCFEIYEMKDKVFDELIKINNFEQILLNEYGNYVIQKALMKSDQNKQQIMFKLLVPLVHKLQCLPFGQKLLSKLFIQYPRLSIYILNSGE